MEAAISKAHGLPEDQALRAVTLGAAEISASRRVWGASIAARTPTW